MDDGFYWDGPDDQDVTQTNGSRYDPAPILETLPPAPNWTTYSAWDAAKNPRPKSEVIVDGLLSRGDTGNLIASTKVGKSWFAMFLLFCVACGERWLGRPTRKGRVCLVDNEIRHNELENRFAAVHQALDFDTSDAAPFDFFAMRGEVAGLGELEANLGRYGKGELSLLVIDAKYRLFCHGMQENSNDDQTVFHNRIDQLASRLDCAVLLIHHSTKGSQATKTVTDIGSGGGSQSRAVDCHMVLRPHEQEGLAVLDAAGRNFAPSPSVTVKWEFPLWSLEGSVKPVVKQEDFRNEARVHRAKQDKAIAILQMLEREPNRTASENKLSGSHPEQKAFRAAISELQGEDRIEWVKDFKPPRSKEPTGGWRLTENGEVD